MKSEIKLNLDGLDKFQKELAKGYKAKVGVIGQAATRSGGDLNNAEIGLVHEAGSVSRGIPARSFLRMPLEHKMADIVTTAINNGKMVENNMIDSFFKKIGAKAESIIQEAFSTHGFGLWPPNAPSTIGAKGSASPLIDTGELRKAISSEVIHK